LEQNGRRYDENCSSNAAANYGNGAVDRKFKKLANRRSPIEDRNTPVKIFDVAKRRSTDSSIFNLATTQFQKTMEEVSACSKGALSIIECFSCMPISLTDEIQSIISNTMSALSPSPFLMPLINVYINGRVYKFLLDTGSSLSLMPLALLPATSKLENIKFKISGVTGQSITPIGRARIQIMLDASTTRKPKYVPCSMDVCVFSELPINGADGILGMDFLVRHGFSIDLQKKQLIRNRERICRIENLDVPASDIYALPTRVINAEETNVEQSIIAEENEDDFQKIEVLAQNCDTEENLTIKGCRHKILTWELPNRFRNKELLIEAQEFAPYVRSIGGIYRVRNDGLVQIPINNHGNEKQTIERLLNIRVRHFTNQVKVESVFEVQDEEQLIKAMDIDKTTTPWYQEHLQRQKDKETSRLNDRKERRDSRKPKYDRYTYCTIIEAAKETDGNNTEVIEPVSYFAQPDLITKSVPSVDERFEESINKELPQTALSNEGKEILRNTLRTFRDVISFKDEPLGRAAIFEQDIALTTNRVIRISQFPLAKEQHGPIEEWVQEMLKFGIIRPSRSPYNSPCMMVKKPKGGWRMVIDFRELNKFLAHDPYPLPDINRTLQELGRNGNLLNFISSLDLLWGFYHIEIQEQDRQKTAFTLPQGRFEYERLPMGMKTSPAAFQRLVDMIIMRNMGSNIFCYVDDVLCYSETEKSHLLHLTKLFSILRKYGMKLNIDKSIFARKQVAHLGHIITATGVQMDISKLKKMEDLPIPTTRKQLKGLLGIASYYRRFIPEFAKIVRPLTNMLRQDVEFEWTEKQSLARKTLIDALRSAGELEFVLKDAKKIISIGFDEHTLSAMLSQERVVNDKKEEKPILFASKVLSPAESRGKIDAKSLKAAKFAIQQFRPYLHNGEIVIRTNDRVLMQLQERTAKELSSTQAKWVALIKDVNPKFEFKTTKASEAINALGACWELDKLIEQDNTLGDRSTNPPGAEPHCAYIAPSFQHELYNPILIGNEWIEMQHRDAKLNNIKQKYDEGETTVLKHYYKDPAGVLYRKFENKVLLVVPDELQKRAIEIYHDTPRAGHYAARRTYLSMKQSVWWKTMESDIHEYINKCRICQYYKARVGKAPSMPRSIPLYPFYLVSIDLVGPLKTTWRGFVYIMVVQDAFSKWIEMIPLRDAKARTVAEMFMNQIVVRYGPPMKILTDRGSQFTSALFQKMCDFLGMKSILTTAYRPQCNGANERTHRELKRYLNMFMGIDGVETEIKVPWDTLARYAAWAYNTSYHAVLKMTPYEVLFGRPPQVHALGALGGKYQLAKRIKSVFEDESENPAQPSDSKLSADDARILRLIKLDKEATENIRNKIRQELENAQKRWGESTAIANSGLYFEPGDFILLRNMRATSNAMIPKYTGPYEVLRRVTPVNYEILREERHYAGRNYKDTVHLDRMKTYNNPNPGSPIKALFLETDPMLAEAENANEEEIQLFDITPAGLDSIIRIPADTRIPVPIVNKYIKSANDSIIADHTDKAGVAGVQIPYEKEDNGIKSAKEDSYIDLDTIQMDQTQAVTRSKAKDLGAKIKGWFPFFDRGSD
jgi:hypothetical protein